MMQDDSPEQESQYLQHKPEPVVVAAEISEPIIVETKQDLAICDESVEGDNLNNNITTTNDKLSQQLCETSPQKEENSARSLSAEEVLNENPDQKFEVESAQQNSRLSSPSSIIEEKAIQSSICQKKAEESNASFKSEEDVVLHKDQPD